MKTGKTLVQLAQEIERQNGAKLDYIVGTNALSMEAVQLGLRNGVGVNAERVEPRLAFTNGERNVLPISHLAHRQIGEKVGVPAKYYDRMLADAPHLLAQNINHWFRNEGEKRLVRTLDGRVRAFLSNSYQRIDNANVAEVVLPVLLEGGSMEVVSAEVTESKLYIKAVDHSVVAEVRGSKRVGDVVEAGVIISNSEVGLGAISVQPFYMFLACLNGMVRNREGMRASHIGTRLDVDDNSAAILADDTRKSIDRTQLLKVRDTVRALLNPKLHQAAIDRMSEQTSQKITASNPAQSIVLLANEFPLGEDERGSVLRHLIESGDLSRFGLMNAVTRTAEDSRSYDRATELEAIGGRIVDLDPRSWQRIAEAA